MVLSLLWRPLGIHKVRSHHGRRISFGQKLMVTAVVKTVGTAVTEAIKAAKTVPVLVDQLNQKSIALCAASALARLVRIGGSP